MKNETITIGPIRKAAAPLSAAEQESWQKKVSDAVASHAVAWHMKGCAKCPPIVVPTRPADRS